MGAMCTLGFSELVDFSADEASQKFFGKGMLDWLACSQN